jgi:hypothetical protein
MWNSNGSCANLRASEEVREPEDYTEEEAVSVRRIKEFVLVGTFLERSSQKDVTDLREKDFPEASKFFEWLADKKIPKSASLDYDKIVRSIKGAL